MTNRAPKATAPLCVAWLNALRDKPLIHAEALSLLRQLNWQSVSDIDIHQLADHHRQLVRSKQPRIRTQALLHTLRCLEAVPDSDVPRVLRHQYLMWHASDKFPDMSFSEFCANPAHYADMQVHGVKRERVESTSARRARQAHLRRAKPTTPLRNAIVDELTAIARATAPDAPERYFAALGSPAGTSIRHEGWLSAPSYPGRTQIDVKKLGVHWLQAMHEWLTFRATRFETSVEPRNALHLLTDYVLCYLPWWFERHPQAAITMPHAPRHFVRYSFVSRTAFNDTTAQPQPVLPKTLLELLALRRPTAEGRNLIVRQLHKFFQFVITHFEDTPQIGGKAMVNPIRRDFDLQRTTVRGKTNKVPFAENIYPYLMLYVQAVEAFGEYLQQRAYEDEVFQDCTLGPPFGYDTAHWGYVPLVRFRGKNYPVHWIPNLYTVARRAVYRNRPGSGIYVNGWRINQHWHDRRGRRTSTPDDVLHIRLPHLTTIRMLMVVLHNGLRAQGAQWLDRRTWDACNAHPLPIEQLHTGSPSPMFTKLLVNTDKSKATEWTTWITFRVRRSLLAEQYFQDGLADAWVQSPVPYENRKHSRFGAVVPLFASSMKAGPVSDSAYNNRWRDLLIGFSDFYNSRPGANVQAPLRLVRLMQADPVVGKVSVTPTHRGSPLMWCPLKYEAVHTPHACRATYLTVRDGDLEVAELANLVGQSSTATTAYYQVPSSERVLSKLEASERRIFDGVYDPSGAAPTFVHAERPDSAVRTSFNRDRDRALAQHGFVPGVALWSTGELDSDDADALALLRESPASVIRWHTTHVCPVGNQCPSDIVTRIGGFYRCGLCPLAAKCVDHLPAIAAKKNELKERIRTASRKIAALSARGADDVTIDALHVNMEGDAKELMGWELATEILHDQLQRLGDDRRRYHADQPEMVRRQLQLVTRCDTDSAFFLQRIADANAYPGLESPEVRARAARFVRVMLATAGKGAASGLLDVEPYDELQAFASLIKPYAEARGLTLPALAAAIEARAAALTTSTSQPRRLLG